MAGTAAGTGLTAQQRTGQLAVRAAALRELIPLWPVLDPARLEQTTQVWMRLAIEVITRWRQAAVLSAADYYRLFRAAETGELVPPKVALINTLDLRRVQTSLLVTGPIRIKALTRSGLDPEKAAEQTLVTSLSAAGRHVLDGGRDALDTAVHDDSRAVGYARVTSAHPCAFCALLASRGPVYKTAETAERTSARSSRGPGRAYHDGCACVPEPVFDADAPWPGKAREWDELYASSTHGTYGKAALRAFRRAYDTA